MFDKFLKLEVAFILRYLVFFIFNSWIARMRKSEL